MAATGWAGDPASSSRIVGGKRQELKHGETSKRRCPVGRSGPVIAESRTDVTDDFVRYARPLVRYDWQSVPLVGGLQRFARLEPIFAARKLAAYVPQAARR